jgi:hypothetical protein
LIRNSRVDLKMVFKQEPDIKQEEWDEAQIEDAMKRLKALHVKVRMLRDTIPKMLDPLVQKHSSPDAMFRVFMRAVESAQLDVKEFTELMRDDASREIFERASKSQLDSGLGVKPWRHKDYPDWYTMDAE